MDFDEIVDMDVETEDDSIDFNDSFEVETVDDIVIENSEIEVSPLDEMLGVENICDSTVDDITQSDEYRAELDEMLNDTEQENEPDEGWQKVLRR